MSSEESIAIVQSSGKLIAVRREEARGGSVKFDEAVRNISLAGEEANQTNPLSAPLREIAAELDDTILSITIPVAQTTCQILTLPTVDSTELDSMTRLRLEQLAPFDAEKLAVSWETLAQDAESTRVIAAALPVESVESWWNAIAECGLRAKRLELSILAWWHAIRASNAIPDSGRQLVLLRDGEAWDFLSVDDGIPSFLRVLSAPVETPEDWLRELTLSLVDLELNAGQRSCENLFLFYTSEAKPDIAAVAKDLGCPLHLEPLPEVLACARSVSIRSLEKDAIDLTPPEWRRQETLKKQRRQMVAGCVVAGLIWLLCAAYLLLAPMVSSMLLGNVRKERQSIAASYREVNDLSARVQLIRNYMDRDLSAIELLRQITLVQPAGVTLSSFTYRRDDGVRLSGETEEASKVYAFKDAVTSLNKGKSDTRLFAEVSLTGPSAAKGGMQRFDLNMVFPGTQEANR